MSESRSDADIVAAIGRMVDEEHQLRQRPSGEGITDEDQARLRAIEVELDRCWDLLRERRAKREFGENPNDAELRSAEVVEHYRQ
jgi:hypothetical protein